MVLLGPTRSYMIGLQDRTGWIAVFNQKDRRSFEWLILAKPHSACQNYDALSRDVTQHSQKGNFVSHQKWKFELHKVSIKGNFCDDHLILVTTNAVGPNYKKNQKTE